MLLTAGDRGGSTSDDECGQGLARTSCSNSATSSAVLVEVAWTVLYVTGVEPSSDMSGVLYTPADEAGAWQLSWRGR